MSVSLRDRLRRAVLARTEILAMVVLLMAALVYTRPVPPGIYALGVVNGSILALQTIGLILVYRSSKIINFAQFLMGLAAARIFTQLVFHRTFLVGLRFMCPVCLPGPSVDAYLSAHPGIAANLSSQVTASDIAVAAAPGWMVAANYWVSALAALLLTVLLIGALYLLVVRRFSTAPRLVLTIVSIGSGFLVLQASNAVSGYIFPREVISGGQSLTQLAVPLPVEITALRGHILHAADILSVVAAVIGMVVLAAYFRLSRAGVVLRASSENARRAVTLGIDVGAINARAWLIAGLLAGVASLLAVMQDTASGGYELMTRGLTAAAVGAFVSFPVGAVAAVALGVIDQALIWHSGSSGIVSVLVFGILVVVLLAQRARSGRADLEEQAGWEASREMRPIPPELRRVPAVRTPLLVLAIVVLGIVLAFPWFNSPGQVTFMTQAMGYCLVTLSLLVLTGWAGQISLGQMGFAAIGAWVAAVTAGQLGWSMLPGMLAAGVGGALSSLVVGLPAMRLRGLHLLATTLAMSLAVSDVVINRHFLGAYMPLDLERPVFLGINFADEKAFYYLALLILAVALTAVVGLRRSRAARALIAAKDNEAACQSYGINLLRTRLMAFAISGFLAALGGAVITYAQRGVAAELYQPEASVTVFLAAVIGGMGSIAGPVLGALYHYALLPILESTPFGQIIGVLDNPGLGVILLLMVLPGGLVSALFAMRDAWLRRTAIRHRISVPSLLEDRDSGPIPVSPKKLSGGATAFVPARYRVEGQWAVWPGNDGSG